MQLSTRQHCTDGNGQPTAFHSSVVRMHQMFPQDMSAVIEEKGCTQGDESPAIRPNVNDAELLLSHRIKELEHVVADYAQRYGLTDLAREIMVNAITRVDR